jgi:hypothetical protein
MSPKTAREIACLQDMSVNQLVDRYERLVGEQCRSRNKPYLIRRIAWRLQADEEGGLSPAALQRAGKLAFAAEVRVSAPRRSKNRSDAAARCKPNGFVDWDPRLPPPLNMIRRQYKGRTIEVMVLSDGFEYEGQHYRSLSAIAKVVTGAHYNGFLFFRLGNTK